MPNNVIDTIIAKDDTVAYLKALKKIYNQKIIERTNFNYGQPKSFLIVDKNGIDLKVKLSSKVVIGLTSQVVSMPDVRKMLDDYNRDSLYVDTLMQSSLDVNQKTRRLLLIKESNFTN